MGTWGYGCFENDDALDWVSNELEGADDIAVVADALQKVAGWEEDEYLELPEAAAALAGAEVLAALLGHASPNLPPEVKAWVEDHPADDAEALVPTALRAIDRVGRNSEMQGNWLAPDGDAKWSAVLSGLRARLAQ